jgi:threonine dehydrogenase-like Zn-dependent dehydrogenase
MPRDSSAYGTRSCGRRGRQAHPLPLGIAIVAEGIIDTERVITHRYDWSEAQTAFRTTVDDPGAVARAVLSGAW